MSKKDYIIPVFTVVCIISLLIYGPIKQDLAYHDFADNRTFFGIPNFLNVVTNLPFAFVGIVGMQLIKRIIEKELRQICLMIFIGFILVTVGSGYYHLKPNNVTLVFDRIPIVIIVLSFFALIIHDYIAPQKGYKALFIFNVIGLVCTIYWMITEYLGRGDVRWYGFAQFFPIIAIPIIMVLYKSHFNYTKQIIIIFSSIWYRKNC